jgi:predicted branched-subunit amino acid permease
VIIGAGLNDLVPNLDFALVCLFAILAYEQFKVLKKIYPMIIAVIAFIIAINFFANWLLLSAIMLSILMIVADFYRKPTAQYTPSK